MGSLVMPASSKEIAHIAHTEALNHLVTTITQALYNRPLCERMNTNPQNSSIEVFVVRYNPNTRKLDSRYICTSRAYSKCSQAVKAVADIANVPTNCLRGYYTKF